MPTTMMMMGPAIDNNEDANLSCHSCKVCSPLDQSPSGGEHRHHNAGLKHFPDYVSFSTVLAVKLQEANCQWLACNARTTATGTGSQVTLVAQAANGVAIAGVAPGGTVDVPVAWHALVAQVANHVLPAQALPVLLTAVPSYRAWPVTLAWQAS